MDKLDFLEIDEPPKQLSTLKKLLKSNFPAEESLGQPLEFCKISWRLPQHKNILKLHHWSINPFSWRSISFSFIFVQIF